MLTVSGVASNYASAIVALGPTAYWRLNETSGTTAYDYIGGYTGTIAGGVTLGQPGATFARLGRRQHRVCIRRHQRCRPDAAC